VPGAHAESELLVRGTVAEPDAGHRHGNGCRLCPYSFDAQRQSSMAETHAAPTPQQQAALAYMEENKIPELFEGMLAAAVFSRPTDVRSFLIDHLRALQAARASGSEASSPALFDADNIAALFGCFDVTRSGYITLAQYDTGSFILSHTALHLHSHALTERSHEDARPGQVCARTGGCRARQSLSGGFHQGSVRGQTAAEKGALRDSRGLVQDERVGKAVKHDRNVCCVLYTRVFLTGEECGSR
jgi:hypothetical protein